MNNLPVRAEVGVVLTILLAGLADVDGLGQLRAINYPLLVKNVGGDLTIRSQPGNDTRVISLQLSTNERTLSGGSRPMRVLYYLSCR